MAGQTINMVQLKQIIRLRNSGVPLQAIAKTVITTWSVLIVAGIVMAKRQWRPLMKPLS